jgi:hypothetical protein
LFSEGKKIQQLALKRMLASNFKLVNKTVKHFSEAAPGQGNNNIW